MSDGAMFHAKQDVARDTSSDVTVQVAGRRKYRRRSNGICGTCLERPCAAKQRRCKECHAAAQLEYRARQKEIRAAERAELARLRAQLQQEKSKGHQNGEGHETQTGR